MLGRIIASTALFLAAFASPISYLGLIGVSGVEAATILLSPMGASCG
jgi:hypothetical protein